jgi:hypothetical protein
MVNSLLSSKDSVVVAGLGCTDDDDDVVTE